MDNGRIYVAEEDKALGNRIRSALKRRGFFVRLFESGYPIVSMMDNWPDVFVIDIELPGVNGMEVCKWLKSNKSSSHIPVIFISSDPYLKVLAATAQADEYVERPFSSRNLMQKVYACLQLR